MRSAATILLLLAAVMSASSLATAAPASITAAVADKDRPEKDRVRDADRKPADVLAFTGVKSGDTVVDVGPGAGYYLRILPWYAFPGANSVRVTEVMVNNMARVVEGQATPEVVLPEMAAEVRRLLPRRS